MVIGGMPREEKSWQRDQVHSLGSMPNVKKNRALSIVSTWPLNVHYINGINAPDRPRGLPALTGIPLPERPETASILAGKYPSPSGPLGSRV